MAFNPFYESVSDNQFSSLTWHIMLEQGFTADGRYVREYMLELPS